VLDDRDSFPSTDTVLIFVSTSRLALSLIKWVWEDISGCEAFINKLKAD
jgi:hypothetical protein